MMNQKKRGSGGSLGKMKRWVFSKLEGRSTSETIQERQVSTKSSASQRITISCDRDMGSFVVTLDTSPNCCESIISTIPKRRKSIDVSQMYGDGKQILSRSLPSTPVHRRQKLPSPLIGKGDENIEYSNIGKQHVFSYKESIPVTKEQTIKKENNNKSPIKSRKEQTEDLRRNFLKRGLQNKKAWNNSLLRGDTTTGLIQKERTSRMIKEAARTDGQALQDSKDTLEQVPIHSVTSEYCSDDTSQSTSSWSMNIGKFQIIRKISKKRQLIRQESEPSIQTSSSITDKADSKTALRSSSVKLRNHFDFKTHLDPSSSGTPDVEYSPKLTPRAPKLVNGQPVDDFKYILESQAFNIPSIYGKIKIMFQYFNDENQFVLTILKGSNIAPRKRGALGLYSTVRLVPGKLQAKTGKIHKDTHDPIFYEHFNFQASLDALLNLQLRIKLYNKSGIFSIPEPVGECTVPLFYYDLTAVTVIWLNLKKSKKQKDELDEFDFSIIDNHQNRPAGCSGLLCGLGR